jgi:hypothetical protein
MAEQNLLGKVGQRAEQWLTSALTGEPPKGSDEDLRKQIQSEQLRQTLASFQKNPNDPAARDAFLGTLKAAQGLNIAGQRAMNDVSLDYVSDPRLMSAAQGKTNLEIQRERAKATNEIDLLKTESQQRMLGLDKLTEHEFRLAGGSQADTNREVLNFLREAQDKNLAAQAAARRPNLGTVAGLLGSLGLAAASLFG